MYYISSRGSEQYTSNITLTVDASPTPAANTTSTATVCEGTNVAIAGNGTPTENESGMMEVIMLLQILVQMKMLP